MSQLSLYVLMTVFILGNTANQAQIVASPIVYETSIEEDYTLLEYGDIDSYMDFQLPNYSENAVIAYVEDLNSKMKNAHVEYKPEYSKHNFLIFSMTEVESTACEQNFVLAWEKNNSHGGMVFESWISEIQGLVLSKYLVVDAGTSSLRYKGLYKLDADKNNVYLQGFSATSDFYEIPGTTWLIYQSYPENKQCKLDLETAMNVRLFDTSSKLNVDLYEVEDYIMWSIRSNENPYKFDIIKWSLNDKNQIVSGKFETIDFGKGALKKLVQHEVSLFDKPKSFEITNRDWSYMGCEIRYYLEGELDLYYKCPAYTGTAKVLKDWDASQYPSGTINLVQVDSDEGTKYIYARRTGNRIEMTERSIQENHIPLDKVLTTIEDKTIIVH